MAQYQVGKVTFASVLEVLRGLVADEGGFLDSLADLQRVAIAQREVSLDPVVGGSARTTGSIPGAAAMGGSRGAERQEAGEDERGSHHADGSGDKRARRAAPVGTHEAGTAPVTELFVQSLWILSQVAGEDWILGSGWSAGAEAPALQWRSPRPNP
jgi:hypothetical protein